MPTVPVAQNRVGIANDQADGQVLAVKMTVKETTGANTPNPLYTIETIEIGEER